VEKENIKSPVIADLKTNDPSSSRNTNILSTIPP